MARGQIYMFEKFAGQMGDGDYDFPNDSWKLAMIDNTSPPSVDDTDITWATIDANEVSGSGYTAGGESLTSVTWTYNSTLDRWEFKAADVSWGITVSGPTDCYYGVLVNTTTGDCAVFIDMGGPVSLEADDIDFEWDADGIFWHKPNASA
jgi:hypothetical protein